MRPIEIVKTNLKIKREHELLLAEAGKADQPGISECSTTSSNHSNASTPNPDVDKLTSISNTSNELLLNKLEFYREFLDKKTLNKLTSNLFYNSTASILMPKIDIKALENSENCSNICDLDLVDQYFNLNAIILIPFKFLIHNKWLDTDLKNLIIVSLCELVECSSYKIRSSWNCVFNCLNKIDLNDTSRSRGVKRFQEIDEFSDRITLRTSNAIEGYVSSSDESLVKSESESDSDTVSSSSLSSLSSECDEDTTMDKVTKLSFTNAAFKFDSKRARLSSLVDIFHIFLSLSEDSDYVLANGAFSFLKCISCYLQYKNIDIDFLISDGDNSLSKDKSSFMNKKKDKKKTKTKEDSVNDFEEEEDLYVATNDNLVQEKHYQQITNYDRLIELSDANDSNSPIKPFLICIEKLFHILIKGLFVLFSNYVTLKLFSIEF